MIRQRFFPTRLARIATWTTIGVAWCTAVVARVAVGSEAEAADAAVASATEATTVRPDISTVTTEAVPELPESGLVVIRHTPTEVPQAETVVRRVVVQRQAQPAPSPAPAKRTKSSGS